MEKMQRRVTIDHPTLSELIDHKYSWLTMMDPHKATHVQSAAYDLPE